MDLSMSGAKLETVIFVNCQIPVQLSYLICFVHAS